MNFISYFKNIAALLIGCLVGLLIVEGILQVYNPFDFRLKGNKIVLPANQKYVMKRKGYNSQSHKSPEKFDDVIVHTKNSLGFRGAEPPEDFNDYLTIITGDGEVSKMGWGLIFHRDGY